MSWAAIRAVARAELRHRRASLAVLALIAGLTGGLVVGGATMARRTGTAYDRLEKVTNADDVRGSLLGRDQEETQAIGEELAAVPGVTAARVAQVAVARLEGPEVVYVALMTGPSSPGDPLQPVVIEGRAPHPSAPDEIVVAESLARDFEIALGRRFGLRALTREEFYRFDAGEPLEGLGPRFEAKVVGLVRLPGAELALPSMYASPAMAESVPGAFALGGHLLAQVDGPAAGRAVEEVAAVINARVELPTEASEFQPVEIFRTETAALTAKSTSDVLVVGLTAFTAVAGLAGLIALAQGLARHQGLSRSDELVESAIGLGKGERLAARVMAIAPVAVLGAAGTLVGGVVAGAFEPLGGVRFLEPNPGFHLNLLVVAIGCAAIAFLTVGLAALAALSGNRRLARSAGRPLREAGLVRRLAGLGGRPPAVVGLRMAFERGSGRTAVPVASSITAVILGVAGVASVAVFASSLHRLVTTPMRFGFAGDMEIVDAGPEVVDALVADERLSAVVTGQTATVEVEGERVSGMTQEARKGTLEWELASGRPPATPDEIVLGTRVARRLGLGTGDTVMLTAPGAGARTLAVVGVGVPPTLSTSTAIGRNVALSADGLARFALADPFPTATVSGRPGIDVEELRAELASRYEVTAAGLPQDVRNLDDLGGLPEALALFMGALALVAIGHAVLVASRRRAADVALLRAIGFTPRQAATSLVVMAAATAATGVVIGLPLGIAGGATVWRAVAEGAGVLGDSLVEPARMALVALATVAIALVLAAGPARRAGRRRPAAILRAE